MSFCSACLNFAWSQARPLKLLLSETYIVTADEPKRANVFAYAVIHTGQARDHLNAGRRCRSPKRSSVAASCSYRSARSARTSRAAAVTAVSASSRHLAALRRTRSIPSCMTCDSPKLDCALSPRLWKRPILNADGRHDSRTTVGLTSLTARARTAVSAHGGLFLAIARDPTMTGST